MEHLERNLERHSTKVNWAINLSLALASGISYVFLLALYLSDGMNLASFKYVDGGSIAPTTIVPVFGIIITSATSALLTRFVEHDLWSTLLSTTLSSAHRNRYDTKETRRRAQWTVSPFARLSYTFNGQSWILRLSGLLILGTVLLNPVLLYGIRPKTGTDTEALQPTDPWFHGFVPYNNSESQRDVMTLAAMASTDKMLNMRLPPANVCSDGRCDVAANVTALQAKCKARSRPLSETEQLYIWSEQVTETTNDARTGITCCNPRGKSTCVKLYRAYEYNFTSGFSREGYRAFKGSKENENITPECPPGDFALITRAWMTTTPPHHGLNSLPEETTLHRVDCRIEHGNVHMKQTGDGTPDFDRASFQASSARIPYYRPDPRWSSDVCSDPKERHKPHCWQLQYLEGQSPWTFTFRTDENGMISGNSPISSYLIATKNEKENSISGAPAEESQIVAETLEASFDIATRLAFARAPHAAFLWITTDAQSRWTYDPRVLFVLVIPFVATILLLCSCRKVYGNEVVVGYDPIRIAQRAGEISPTTLEEYHGSGKSERTESTISKEEDDPDEAQPLSLESHDLERGREAMEPLMFRTGSSFQEEYEHAASLIGREDHGSREGHSEIVGSDQSEVDGSSSHRRLARRSDSPVSVSSQPK